jgi:RNA polymerase sigma-70 factor, ECF subfamily
VHTHSSTFLAAPGHHSVLADDQELLRRSARGDETAFETLFRRHRDGLQGFLYRKLRNHEEAEDALTLTFSNAWRARQTFRGHASGKAWLYQIGTRVALDMLRRRRRQPTEQELEEHHSDRLTEDGQALNPEQMLLDVERTRLTRDAIRQAVGRLPEEERRLVILFYFDGCSYEQISSLLGVSRSQVRGRLHRIRSRIRQDLVGRQRWQYA